MDRRLAAAIAAVIVAFGGGFLLAKGVDGTLFTPAGVSQALAYLAVVRPPPRRRTRPAPAR